MNKIVKAAIISGIVIAVIIGAFFAVIPLATSNEAKARLGEALADLGISGDDWRAENTYYVPLLGRLVINKFEIGERGSSGSLEIKKITIALDTGRNDLFAGSINAREISLLLEGVGITVDNFSIDNFSVDTELFHNEPLEAVKKLGKISMDRAVFTENGRTYFSLGKFNADIGYTEGKIPLDSSVTLKDFVIDIRKFIPNQAWRPEYRLSTFELKNNFSNGDYKASFVIDGVNLFSIKTEISISFPYEFLSSGEINALAGVDFDEDIKFNSFIFTYTDKSFLDHAFGLAGVNGGKEHAAEELRELLMVFAMMGGDEAERLADEAARYIAKPGKLELKTNFYSPMSFEDLSKDPFGMNLSLSLNNGKPFTIGDF